MKAFGTAQVVQAVAAQAVATGLDDSDGEAQTTVGAEAEGEVPERIPTQDLRENIWASWQTVFAHQAAVAVVWKQQRTCVHACVVRPLWARRSCYVPVSLRVSRGRSQRQDA